MHRWRGGGAAEVKAIEYSQAWIPELGMYHYKARVYSSTLGRFLQTDPIGYDDQMNLYAYVGNDPVNNTDPTGLNKCPTEICVTGTRLPKDDTAKLGVISRPDAADRRPPGPARPQRNAPNCSQGVINFGRGLVDFSNNLNHASDMALIGAGGVAVAGAAFGATGIGLPAGVAAGAVAGSLATTGTIGKVIASGTGLMGNLLIAGQTKNGSFTLATAASFVGPLVTVRTPTASFFQDKMVSGASRLIGADEPPTRCPAGG